MDHGPQLARGPQFGHPWSMLLYIYEAERQINGCDYVSVSFVLFSRRTFSQLEFFYQRYVTRVRKT